MPPLSRLIFFIISLFTGFFFFFYFSVSSIPYSARPSLFPQSAIISLTDDNSTFFMARPAAFGPMLPRESKGGLTGRLFVVEEGELGCEDVKEEGVWGMRKVLQGWGMGGLDDGEENSALGSDSTLIPRLDYEKESLDDDGEKEIPFATPVTDLITSKLSSKKQSRKTSFEEYKLSLSSHELELASHADIETLQDSALMEGRIILIQRGGCGFLEKVLWAQRRGALALIVGDSQRGRPLLTMYARGDTSNVTIPSLFTTYTTAHLLSSLMPPDQATKRRHGTGGGESDGKDEGSEDSPHIGGLWITLTSTRGATSPFFDTLLVLVISPLVTLGIVYVMLTLRASIQRRRWRAPKSVVDSFPVRIYTSRDASPWKTENSNGMYRDEVGQVDTGEVQSVTSRSPPHSTREEQALPMRNTPSPISSPVPSSPPTGKPTSKKLKSRESVIDQPMFYSTVSDCVICLEEYTDGVSQVMRLPCGHEFHVGCITPWLVTRRRTCPICKIDVVKGKSDSSDGDGADDLENGNGTASDSSSSGDSNSGYDLEVDYETEGWLTSYRGLFDWRRLFGGIRLGLGHERISNLANEVIQPQVDADGVNRIEPRFGRRSGDGSRGGSFTEREANERTPLIQDHVGGRL